MRFPHSCHALSLALLVGCAGSTPAPPTVVIAAAAEPTAAPAPREPAQTAEMTRDEAIQLIDARLRRYGPGKTTATLEPDGKLTKRDATDLYEEEFYLKDVDRVAYVHEAEWTVPHVARVFLKDTGLTRYHRGDEPWNDSTLKEVSLAVSDKKAAEEMVKAMHVLLGR